MWNFKTACFALLFTFFGSTSLAHDLCDRDAIRKAIQEAKNSKEAKALAGKPLEKTNRPVGKNVSKILNQIESSVFGQRTFQIQKDMQLPNMPPMATMDKRKGMITISPQTLDSINQRLARPAEGGAFIIAHEIAHFVQDLSIAKSPKKLSPSGLKEASPDEGQPFNQLHAETDCIAVEILHQAGYPLNDSIFKALQIIRDECPAQQTVDFCRAADQIRQSSVRSYIDRFYSTSAIKTDEGSKAISPAPAKTKSESHGAQ